MKVLALCTFPLEAAASRYRLFQYVEPLNRKDIYLEIIPFLNKDDFSSLYKKGKKLTKTVRMLYLTGKRFYDTLNAGGYDAILVQREAMLFGPPIFEWLSKKIGKCPMILDLDDATYISYVSPTYGRIGSVLKFFGKTDKLIDWSEVVICGNRNIAEYVEKRGSKALIIPTIVDTDEFCPVEKKESDTPVIGWIGTHSTFPFLESLFPVIEDLAREHKFTLKIVGSGKDDIDIKGVNTENLQWSLERETADFQSLDIGLYPMKTTDLIAEEWLLGKSGFKAIQYMSVGIPYVVTPLGATKEIGIENETHFTAESKEQWHKYLKELLSSFELRKEMGARGRNYALENYTVPLQADIIAETLYEVVGNFR